MRVILAEGRAWKLVKYETGEAKGKDVARIELKKGVKEPREVVAELKKGLGEPCFAPASPGLRRATQGAQGPARIVVVGVGTFVVSEPMGKGKAAGKVALVTGAAQGFGREIAEGLAAEGAMVALGDKNEAGVMAAAKEICKKHGEGRAMGLALDVTDEESIKGAVDRIVAEWGGMDVVISNAGVLRAGSVKTQPVEEFDLVTDVNYRGYFLLVQKSAPVLAVGHMARAEYTSDIIQINSKSGLMGSNRNSAYAGSKFGGVGLTQSFALELMEDGIKVNAICPGNYFDGPLWSDPENGLFVQYLRTGKVPGAKSIADVKKAYEAKVPMGRGCRTEDVMHAIFYAMEQQYETGQAIPVTGGQVMLA